MVEHYPGTAPGDTGSGSQVGQAAEQAKQQTQQFSQQAGELANRGSEQVKSQIANQKHEASQRMTPVQTALRETGQQLRKQGQEPVAEYADKAADQVERFSGYLRETEVDEILDERPALFLGSAVALGFFATRFLKSSSGQGASVGNGSSATLTATSSARVPYRTEEPATALPPSSVEGSPTARRSPLTDQPLSERQPTDPPRGA
jgi:hypothetical protein